MSNEIEFIDGLIFKAPNENAPDYVKAKLSIKRADLIAWLQGRDEEWINGDVKVSHAGKWYSAVDNWRPNGQAPQRQATTRQATAPSDDPPF
jgi:hypothetical protein